MQGVNSFISTRNIIKKIENLRLLVWAIVVYKDTVFNNLVITEYKIVLPWAFNLLQIHSIALGHDNSDIFFNQKYS